MRSINHDSRLMAAARSLAVLVAALLSLALSSIETRAGATEEFLGQAFPNSPHGLSGGFDRPRADRSAGRSFDAEGYDERPARASRSRRASSRSQTGSDSRASRRTARIAPEDIEGEWSSEPRRTTRSSRRGRGVRVASLGDGFAPAPSTGRGRSLAGGGISWVANSGCLTSSLRAVISQVAQNYGSVTVNSTCRSHSHNTRVGGAPRSHHLTGNAADFRVHGNVSAAYAFLRGHGSVGGLKHYGGGLFHIDTGARRSW